MYLSTAKSRTVILFGQEDLLVRSIEIFLASLKGWEVVRIDDICKVDVLMSEVASLTPDVVILCQDNRFCQEDLPWLLVQLHPHLKVVTIGPANSEVGIYHKKNVWLHEVNDLLDIIDND